jgi:hypothetical protein
MKLAAPALALALLFTLAPHRAHSQASEIPSAQSPPAPGTTAEQRGRHLLDQMVEALGGDAWRHRKDMTGRARVAYFFHGAPTGQVTEFAGYRIFDPEGFPLAERIGFITDKSMILPGKKTDVVQVWVGTTGYEVTYKGRTELPHPQVEDYYLRLHHSIENVVDHWLKQPGVMVLDEGEAMVGRRLAKKISVLSTDNDAVTIEVDENNFLPLRLSFQSRDPRFKDFNEEAEEYDDYHTIQGLPTAMTLTRYVNGDIVSQRFYTTVEYNKGLDPALFNPDNLLQPAGKQKK